MNEEKDGPGVTHDHRVVVTLDSQKYLYLLHIDQILSTTKLAPFNLSCSVSV